MLLLQLDLFFFKKLANEISIQKRCTQVFLMLETCQNIILKVPIHVKIMLLEQLDKIIKHLSVLSISLLA